MSFHQWLQQSLEEIVNDAIFDEGHNEMVLVRDINVFSLCETTCCHLWAKLTLPISQKSSGLSKLARIVEMYARRLQVQDDTPDRRSDSDDPGTTGVAAVMEATYVHGDAAFKTRFLDCHQCNGRCVWTSKKPAKSSLA